MGNTSLPTLIPTSGKGLALKGLPTPKIPGVGTPTTQSIISKKIGDIAAPRIRLAGLLDYTASTSELVMNFRNTIGALVADTTIKHTLYPIVFNGQGVSIGKQNDIHFYQQENIGGTAPIIQGLELIQANNIFSDPEGMHIALLITDTGVNEHNNGSGGESMVGYLKKSDALLLIMLDNPNWEQLIPEYREKFSTLGENLIIIGGGANINNIIKEFAAGKGIAKNTRTPINVGDIFRKLSANNKKLAIAHGNNPKILRIENSMK